MKWQNTENGNWPEKGIEIHAIIKFCTSDTIKYVKLKTVDESDVSFRFPDDNAELSYDWDVVSWAIVEGD